MIDFCVITGSGFYDFPGATDLVDRQIQTRHGSVGFAEGRYRGQRIAFIPRHRHGHALLPNMIDYRANCAAMAALKPRAVIATSICGILNKTIPLGRLMIFGDLFFPDNRLPSGEICSMFSEEEQAGRGHLMFSNPFYDVSGWFSPKEALTGMTYGHVNGPRFNSRKEISFLARYCDAISQTCGPETILCNELETPYILLGFGVDYANGVMEENTPIEELEDNMEKSQAMLTWGINRIFDAGDEIAYSNFVYRIN